MLLKVGRHIRPNKNFKLIIAREEGEARFLEGYKNAYSHMHMISHRGPLALIDGQPNEQDLELAARIIARYGQGRDADSVRLRVTHNKQETEIDAIPLPADEIPQGWHV